MNPLFIISSINDYVILKNNNSFQNILEFKLINYDIIKQNNEELKFEFRWSFNNNIFSNWLALTVENLNQYIDLSFREIWIEYRVILLSEGEVAINSITLDVNYIIDNDFIPSIISEPSEKGNLNYPIKIKPFSYNPYKQNPTLKLQQDLSMIVNNLHGHEVTYFRSEPNKKSRDVVFLEWSLYEYLEPQHIKLLVPENEFPDNKLNFNHWGIEFEQPFEVHVDRRYWEFIFGKNTMPQKRDAIYFPIVNRMYKVDSSQLVKDFMQHGIYYKLSLTKWSEQSNIKQTDEIKNMLDEVTTSVSELFGEEIDMQINNTTNIQQTIDKTSKEDPIRLFTNIDINNFIIEEHIENNKNLIANYYYDMNKAFLEYNNKTLLSYNNKFTINKTQNLCFTAWFRTIESKIIIKEIQDITFFNETDCIIDFKYGLPNITEHGYIKIYNLEKEIYGEVININKSLNKFQATIRFPEYLLQILLNQNPDWFNSTNLKGEPINKSVLLSTDEINEEFSINIFNNKLIELKISNVSYWFNININPNIWYAIVLNINNIYNQININIWKRGPINLQTSKLINIFTETINGLNNFNIISDNNYKLISSPLHITNIRLLSEIIDEEKQSLFLNQNILTHSHVALIIDNAIPRMRLPYIADVK